jgi:multidrug efflux system membrane fusion protein
VSVRPLAIAFTQGDVTVIAKGLEAGEIVVSDGQSQLRPGAKIAAKQAESAKPSGSAP